MKHFCEKHHFTYSSNRCPFCEKDRIADMAEVYKKYTKKSDNKPEDTIIIDHLNIIDTNTKNKELSWDDLATKFNIIK